MITNWRGVPMSPGGFPGHSGTISVLSDILSVASDGSTPGTCACADVLARKRRRAQTNVLPPVHAFPCFLLVRREVPFLFYRSAAGSNAIDDVNGMIEIEVYPA